MTISKATFIKRGKKNSKREKENRWCNICKFPLFLFTVRESHLTLKDCGTFWSKSFTASLEKGRFAQLPHSYLKEKIAIFSFCYTRSAQHHTEESEEQVTQLLWHTVMRHFGLLRWWHKPGHQKVVLPHLCHWRLTQRTQKIERQGQDKGPGRTPSVAQRCPWSFPFCGNASANTSLIPYEQVLPTGTVAPRLGARGGSESRVPSALRREGKGETLLLSMPIWSENRRKMEPVSLLSWMVIGQNTTNIWNILNSEREREGGRRRRRRGRRRRTRRSGTGLKNMQELNQALEVF